MAKNIFSLTRALKIAAAPGIVFCLLAIAACNQSPETEDPNPPRPLTIVFNVFNSTKGLQGSFSQSGQTVTQMSFPLSSFNVQGVNPSRAVLREVNNGGKLGKFKKYANNGSIDLIITNAEGASGQVQYDLFLFNSTNNVDYEGLEVNNPSATYRFGTMKRVDRDGMTGPDYIFVNVVNQFNEALNPFGILFGEIRYLGVTTESANMECGYGLSNGNDGWHEGNWWTINPNRCNTETSKLSIGNYENFETYFGVDDISSSIQNLGTLTPKGKDIIAYFAIKADD